LDRRVRRQHRLRPGRIVRCTAREEHPRARLLLRCAPQRERARASARADHWSGGHAARQAQLSRPARRAARPIRRALLLGRRPRGRGRCRAGHRRRRASRGKDQRDADLSRSHEPRADPRARDVGLGLDRAGRGECGLMPRRVGWLALVLAVSGSGFLWVAISRANVFCGGGPDECPSLIGEAPRYIAVFGMLVPAIAISVVLDRHRLVPRLLSVSAIVLSALALAVSTDWFVYSTIVPLELIFSLIWATAVGVYLITLGSYGNRVATRGSTAG